MFIWDAIYLDVLSSYGKEGEKAKIGLLPICQSKFEKFKTQKMYAFNEWINQTDTPETPFYISEFLKIFVSVIWEEKIKSKVNFAAKNPAGTTTNVTPSLIQILNPGNSIKTTSDELQLHNKKNSILASVSIATFDPRMIERLMLDEINPLSSLTAVKFIRYLIQETYNQYANGNPKFFDLEFPGGGRQIARCLGLKSGSEVYYNKCRCCRD